MKAYCWFFAITVLAVWQAFSGEIGTHQWGSGTNNVQMSVSLKGGQKEIETNQPLILSILIRNVSTNATFILPLMNWIEADPGFSIVVISPTGKDVSPKPKIGAHGSADLAALGPNQSIKREFNLGSLCKLNEIGTYRIIMKRQVWFSQEEKAFQVVSNPLDVHVVSLQ